MEEKKLCPKCGERSMVRKEVTKGKFSWVCEICSTQRGLFKKDSKKGIV